MRSEQQDCFDGAVQDYTQGLNGSEDREHTFCHFASDLLAKRFT
jgi:hypothetical protein